MGNGHSSPIQNCLNAICADRTACVTYPGDPLFAWWSKPFNLEFPVVPIAIIRPQTANEVAEAVKCATKNGLKVQAKSGGHSYGYALRERCIAELTVQKLWLRWRGRSGLY